MAVSPDTACSDLILMRKDDKLRLFYVAPGDIGKDSVVISGAEYHHAVHVMRMKKGDLCQVFDGYGNVFIVELAEQCEQTCLIAVIKERIVTQKESIAITLGQAIPQRRKFEHIVEKATELGVSAIMPMITDRTIYRCSSAKQKKVLERWKKDSLEAAKQSRKSVLPEITMPALFKDIIETCPHFDAVLLPALCGTMPFRKIINTLEVDIKKKEAPYTVLLLIGPEGGFTDDEVSEGRQHGAHVYSLGKTVLKTDTAMITCLGALKQMLTV